MRYSERINDLQTWFWKTPESRYVADKRQGKALARSLGVPTPRDYELPNSFVFKPIHGHSCQGVVLARPSDAYILEELIEDEAGYFPRRDFKVFVFGGEPRLVQLNCRTENYASGGAISHWSVDWEPVRLCRKHRPWFQCEPPACLQEILASATVLGRQFTIPARVDFYASTRGAVFGEFCATPGLRSITEKGDEYLGDLWARYHTMARRGASVSRG